MIEVGILGGGEMIFLERRTMTNERVRFVLLPPYANFRPRWVLKKESTFKASFAAAAADAAAAGRERSLLDWLSVRPSVHRAGGASVAVGG